MNNYSIDDLIEIDTSWPYPLPDLHERTKKEKILDDLRMIFIVYFRAWIRTWRHLIKHIFE